MVLEIIQALLGIVLFAVAGFSFVKAFFNDDDLDSIERVALGAFLALAIPSIVLIALVLALNIPFSTILVFAVYILCAAIALAYSIFFLKKKVW